jgi:hypothetical protein
MTHTKEPVADGLIRQYITALVANKPDEAANATKAMVDYVYTIHRSQAEGDKHMTQQPTALLLAQELDAYHTASHHKEAAGELRRLHAVNVELVDALEALLKRDERNTCQHQRTHRGGAIWEICDDFGQKWADDRGGKPAWTDPVEWNNARAALAAAKE